MSHDDTVRIVHAISDLIRAHLLGGMDWQIPAAEQGLANVIATLVPERNT